MGDALSGSSTLRLHVWLRGLSLFFCFFHRFFLAPFCCFNQFFVLSVTHLFTHSFLYKNFFLDTSFVFSGLCKSDFVFHCLLHSLSLNCRHSNFQCVVWVVLVLQKCLSCRLTDFLTTSITFNHTNQLQTHQPPSTISSHS